jgi:hypothetical protein
MATAKKEPADAGQSEVQDAFTEAQKQGFFGQGADPLPNSAHSLESGPEAPTVAEQRAALSKKEA